jgi:hypothetical protein
MSLSGHGLRSPASPWPACLPPNSTQSGGERDARSHASARGPVLLPALQPAPGRGWFVNAKPKTTGLRPADASASIEHAPYPDYLTRGPFAVPPPPLGAPLPLKVRWLHHHLRLLAAGEAAMEMIALLGPKEGQLEVLQAAIGLGRDTGIPGDIAAEAARIAWREAVQAAGRFLDDLRRRI